MTLIKIEPTYKKSTIEIEFFTDIHNSTTENLGEEQWIESKQFKELIAA